MSKDQNNISAMIEAVQARVPSAQNIRLADSKARFLNGALYTFAFEMVDQASGEQKSYTNRVYVHGGRMDVFGNDEMLLAIVGETHRKSLIETILALDGISGLIAILLTGTICYLTFATKGDIKIPDILANALTVILGFYFGKASSR